jgi:hypothetical protein
MSNLEDPSSPSAEGVGSGTRSDRLRVITAGRVGNMEARLRTSGFDVVAAAETENALIDAVSVDEPDAIVVEADLCASLELVRDLAPDAVVIVVGDHTPPGALGRVERGMSGTAMAGLLRALVGEGVGAAVVWGLVPMFRAGALRVPQRVGLSLLSANADLVRAHLASALRDPTQLVTMAGTVALTVSASLLVTFSGPRTYDRPERVPAPAATVERAHQHPVVTSPSVGRPAQSPSRNEGEHGGRRGPNRGESRNHGRHADQGENRDKAGGRRNQDHAHQGENQDNDSQGRDHAHEGENQGNNDQGENQDNDSQGRDHAHRGENQENNDQGENQDDADPGKNEGGQRPEGTEPSMAFGVAPLGPREERGM